MITEAYEQAGIQACGEPWKMPEMVYWNLTGNTLSFPVQANTPGTIMLSGFNMNALKILMRGGDPKAINPSDERNSWNILVETLGDERYDEVRKIIESSKEL